MHMLKAAHSTTFDPELLAGLRAIGACLVHDSLLVHSHAFFSGWSLAAPTDAAFAWWLFAALQKDLHIKLLITSTRRINTNDDLFREITNRYGLVIRGVACISHNAWR